MFNFSKISLLLTITLVMGCSSVRVSQDFNPTKKLDNLTTYAWKTETQPPTGDIRVDNPLLDARIRAAVENNLTARRYQKLTDGTPDFHIVYQYAIQRKIESDQVQTGVGFGFGSYGRRGGIGFSTGSNVSEFDEGLLVIDFLGAGESDLLWRGSGSRRVDQHSDPAQITERINEIVNKIMAQISPLPK